MHTFPMSLNLGDAGVYKSQVKVYLLIPIPVLATCSEPTDLSLYGTILDVAYRYLLLIT